MRPGFAPPALALLATLVAAAAILTMAPAPSGADTTTHTVVMLPIVVHSAESREYLRQGLADMLSSRMTQTGGFELIRVEDPEAATTDLEEAMKKGRAYPGADFVLFGSFTRFGTGASLDMQCAALRGPADREPLREIFVHSGSIGEVIPDLDELVGKIARFTRDGRPSPPGVAAGGDASGLGPLEAHIRELEARIESLEKAEKER